MKFKPIIKLKNSNVTSMDPIQVAAPVHPLRSSDALLLSVPRTRI